MGMVGKVLTIRFWLLCALNIKNTSRAGPFSPYFQLHSQILPAQPDVFWILRLESSAGTALRRDVASGLLAHH